MTATKTRPALVATPHRRPARRRRQGLLVLAVAAWVVVAGLIAAAALWLAHPHTPPAVAGPAEVAGITRPAADCAPNTGDNSRFVAILADDYAHHRGRVAGYYNGHPTVMAVADLPRVDHLAEQWIWSCPR